MRLAKFFGWATAATMVLGVAVPVPAAVITYTTPPGSTQDSHPVSVSAQFTTSANQLVIVGGQDCTWLLRLCAVEVNGTNRLIFRQQ